MAAFEMLRIANTSLGMHQTWLDALSHNIANVNTVRSTDENAFQAQMVIARSRTDGGVDVSGVALSDAEGRLVHDPGHPLADAERPRPASGHRHGQPDEPARDGPARLPVQRPGDEERPGHLQRRTPDRTELR